MSVCRDSVILSFGCALFLAGCTVGPNYVRPERPAVSAYTSSPLRASVATPNVAGGESQRLNDGEEIPAQWWELFHSTALNALVERALHHNHDLKAAEAALVVAHENMLAQRGSYYPSATASFSASRSKSSADLSPTPSSGALLFSLYTPEVAVSFVPDVFGLNRRQVEVLAAQEQVSRFQREAIYLALTSNVVVAAIQEASLRTQISATHALIDLNERSLAVLREQKVRGYAGQLDVAAQEAQVAQARSALPPLLKQLALQRDLLGTLSGALPDQDLPEHFELSQLQLPTELPLSLPSRLVEQRPDVRQAEENLHAACAAIGVAIANRLPNVTLTADAGKSAVTFGALTEGGTGFWDLGASIAQPLFEGGALMHKERAARAAFEQAREQYRSTVLAAFQNVADTLAALEHDAEALQASASSANAAKTALDLVQVQQRAGYANYLQLLSAEQMYQNAIVIQVQAQANRYTDTAALLQALGGGWWNRYER
jgi:NodT family efflux transporter outer membrane factor (OMF) lipoprotein